MAQVKISNLPQITTYDNASVLPIVDSGSTQTSKINVTDFFRASGQTITGDRNLILTSGEGANDTQITNGTRHTIISARGGIISDNENSVIMSSYAGGNTPTIQGGGNTNSIISAYNNVNISGGFMTNVTAVENASISGGYTAMIGASSNVTLSTFVGNANQTAVLASNDGNLESSQASVVLGSSSFTGHLQGSSQGGIITSASATVEPISNSARYMTIINSFGSTLRPNENMNMITNSDSVSIDDSNSSNMKNGYIVNSWGGGINGNGIGTSYQKFLANSYGTQITNGGSRIVAFNANGGGITGSGDHNMLLNTEEVTISGSGFNKVTMLGVYGADKTALYSDTVHTGAIHNFGARSGRVVQGGNVSGTVDVNGNAGEMFEFSLTGDTQPNFINLREGQKFLFAIYNDGGHNVTGGTINGVGGNVLAKGGTISPSNNAWSFYTGWYDGTRVFLIEENGLSAI